MDKIAVKCESQEEADKVRSKTGKSIGCNRNWSESEPYYDSKLDRGVGLSLNGFHDKGWFERQGFNMFISASEFLGKEEPMFQVGDEVRFRSEKPFIVVEINKCGDDTWLRPVKGEETGLKAELCKLTKPSKATLKEEEMNTLLSKVLAESKLSDAELVIKYQSAIIGDMKDTLVNLNTLEAIGAKKLIAMAKNLKDAEEAEANKPSE